MWRLTANTAAEDVILKQMMTQFSLTVSAVIGSLPIIQVQTAVDHAAQSSGRQSAVEIPLPSTALPQEARQAFGDTYARYAARVLGWFPNLHRFEAGYGTT